MSSAAGQGHLIQWVRTPTPARQASHRIENAGLAGEIPKIKHSVIKTAGRKLRLNG